MDKERASALLAVSTTAFLLIAIGLLLFDFCAWCEGELTLSEVAREYIRSHKDWTTAVAVGVGIGYVMLVVHLFVMD